jgi:hypothetical protein
MPQGKSEGVQVGKDKVAANILVHRTLFLAPVTKVVGAVLRASPTANP